MIFVDTVAVFWHAVCQVAHHLLFEWRTLYLHWHSSALAANFCAGFKAALTRAKTLSAFGDISVTVNLDNCFFVVTHYCVAPCLILLVVEQHKFVLVKL
ncbi:MAG TPA: hypothetical protein DEO41_01060 [Betaproteobacteria bacterium]|nr:hypothetical protein [Betaproteobacteria bacterium]